MQRVLPKLRWVATLAALLAAPALAEAQRTAAADASFIARAVANQQEAMKRLVEYCFRQRILEEKLTSDNKIERHDEREELVCHRDGAPLYKQLVINGRPTGQRETDPWPAIRNDSNWKKQVRRAAERTGRLRTMIGEVPKAFDLTPMGEEVIDGRPAIVYRLTPKPGYQPKSRNAEVLKCITGRVWVDREAAQMVRFQAQVERDFSMWGGLLLKVRKGGAFQMRQKLVNGVWLPHFSEERWHARIGLVKHLGYHQHVQRTDFRPPSQAFAQK